MAGPKKSLPPPIDRPLSKAYLRQFTGWSTAHPPGLSEPTSCRVMENVYVRRNGEMAVRPGLRYMTYSQTPDMDTEITGVPGRAVDQPVVGSYEPFYTYDGSMALLFAVREQDETVGFRALLFSGAKNSVYRLNDPKIGFYIPGGDDTYMNFSSATTYVKYLQIDNKIMALSDAGESMRLFLVGGQKVAKRLNPITQPEWVDGHKLTVVHPDAAWILKQGYQLRRNELLNPSFEIGFTYWERLDEDLCAWEIVDGSAVAGQRMLRLRSKPARVNLQYAPLHDVAATGLAGWHSHQEQGNPDLLIDGSWMKVFDKKGTGRFLAYGAKLEGVVPGRKYKLAFDYEASSDTLLTGRLTFYGTNGSRIGSHHYFTPGERQPMTGRYETPSVEAPPGAVTVRVAVGGDSSQRRASWIKVKNVVVCRKNESSAMFSVNSGADYFWDGEANKSATVHHPPQTLVVRSSQADIRPATALAGSIYVRASGGGPTAEMRLRMLNKNKVEVDAVAGSRATTGTFERITALNPDTPASAVKADLTVTVPLVARGVSVFLDCAMIEHSATADTYFDGSTPNVYGPEGQLSLFNRWSDVEAPHASVSLQDRYVDSTAIPPVETPNADTLISTDPTKNTFKAGFFYMFENEVGESSASKITEVVMQRPASNWKWLMPKSASDPTPDPTQPTQTADLCADQLVAYMPEDVYRNAVAAGAVRWTLYGFYWSNQDVVPVEGMQLGVRELYPDVYAQVDGRALAYSKGGWINVTPARKMTLNSAFLPTKENLVNYSVPPKARNGLVAADRTILVGDPNAAATINWTSARPGEYLSFTANRGGGKKTLSAGNLHLPGAVALWQNPQSVDTLTVLCLGSDGLSTCYYMTPAAVNAQSSSTTVMGFEETTNTPGSMAPYGVEVVNNALWRPIDRALLKSTAQNYNINHKPVTDDIADMWTGLNSKNWIISSNLDNRLYYVVNNPLGASLEDDCKGNEIWVYDLNGGKTGTWSRFLIQASSVKKIEFGGRVYMGVSRPDGLYYLDPDARLDDVVTDSGIVEQRAIPWYFETNTQGANRAHDAWAHLQQVSVSFGDFYGTARYGVKGVTLNGNRLDTEKIFEDLTTVDSTGLSWDVIDHLLVRRDAMEWRFFAGSVDGKPSSGSVGWVQYRYTPISVNVGYEYGSVETFEYGRNVVDGGDVYSTNGIPTPMQDMSRP
jgi:hypothetical protein